MAWETDFTQIYDDLDRAFSREYMNSLAKEIRDLIINNIQMNKNVFGEELQAYDPKYEKRKIKLGYGPGVNLTLYGSLMRNLVYKTVTNGFEIYIRDRGNNANNAKMIKYGLGMHKNGNVFSWEGIIKATLLNLIDERVTTVFGRS